MRYRIVSFIVLLVFVTVTLYFYTMNSHFVMEASGNHPHGTFSVPEDTGEVPEITAGLVEEADGTVTLETAVKHFQFVRNSGAEATSREGHAHLYINGEKEGRIFGAKYPLGKIEEDLEIQIKLSTHDHRLLTYKGEEIKTELEYKTGAGGN